VKVLTTPAERAQSPLSSHPSPHAAMVNGAHLLLYSHNAEADRALLRDALGFRSVTWVAGG
jgi:hypothetical protein